MHRASYPNVPPTQSPPLHHPVPQHVSTVPQLRSPPPPVPQPQAASSSYGYPGQAPPVGGAASSYDHPAFNQFRNDPMAQMAFQALKGGMDMASKEVDQNLNRWINVASLKQYFNVSNSYVVSKLCLILWPWRHRPWTRQQRLSHDGQDGLYLPPREDVNAPDMYIPLMALITYILISALMAGLKSAFHPELFGSMATKAIISVAAEILLLKASMYLWLNINSTAQLLDLVAYSGYKFVSVIVILVFDEMWSGGGWFSFRWWVRMTVFLYTWFALGLVLIRSLKYVLLPQDSPNHNSGASYTASKSHRESRRIFLAIYSYAVQGLLMGFLTWQNYGSSSNGGSGKA